MANIKIEPQKSYRIKIGERDFGLFSIESEWEGFAKLTNVDSGEKKIIIIYKGNLGEMNNILGISEEKIIVASPDICALINQETMKEVNRQMGN